MSRIYSNATEPVGRTPLARVNRLAGGADAIVLTKLEFYDPANPVKDRIAVAIIDTAIAAGKFLEGGTIVRGTSGNTRIDLAWVGAVRGYRVVLTIPSSVSKERRALLRTFGMELVLTELALGICGTVDKAKEVVTSTDGAILASQFANEADPAVHEKTADEKIWEDIDGKVSYLISGIGTRGTITGAGRALRRHNPQIKLIAVEPAESTLLSGGKAGSHKVQRLGVNFVLDVLDTDLYDKVVTVPSDEAIAQAWRTATGEGLLVDISSGATLAVVVKIAKRPRVTGRAIVVIIPDFDGHYASAALFEGLID